MTSAQLLSPGTQNFWNSKSVHIPAKVLDFSTDFVDLLYVDAIRFCHLVGRWGVVVQTTELAGDDVHNVADLRPGERGCHVPDGSTGEDEGAHRGIFVSHDPSLSPIDGPKMEDQIAIRWTSSKLIASVVRL